MDGNGQPEASDFSAAPEPRPRPVLRLVREVGPPSPLLAGKPFNHQDNQEPMPEQNAVMLDRALQARIGALLREVFTDVANAPVPNRFAALLEALSQKDKSRE